MDLLDIGATEGKGKSHSTQVRQPLIRVFPVPNSLAPHLPKYHTVKTDEWNLRNVVFWLDILFPE